MTTAASPPFVMPNGKLFVTEMVDQVLAGDRHPAAKDERRASAMYPHMASAKITDPKSGIESILGTCARQCWYDLRKVPPSDAEPNARMERIMAMGNLLAEAFVYEPAKRAGIYVADEVSFLDLQNVLSGRYDLMVRLPNGEMMGLDVKSVGGNKEHPYIVAKNGFSELEPRWKDIPQILCYMQWYLQHGVKYWGLYYISREGNVGEFCFEWANLPEGAKRPSDDSYLRCWGPGRTFEIPWLTWGQVRRRFAMLHDFLKRGEMPQRDFQIRWPNSHVVRLAQNQGGNQFIDMNQTDAKAVLGRYDRARKANPGVDIDTLPPFLEKGDWNCVFCKWKTLCWSGLSPTGTESQPIVESNGKTQPTKPARPVADRIKPPEIDL